MDTSSTQGPIPWSKISTKRSRKLHEDSTRESKLPKEEHHWLHPIPTHNQFSALSSGTSSEKPQPPTTEVTHKPPPIFVSDVTVLPPLLQLLDQIAPQQYEIKALANNQVRIKPSIPEAYRAIVKSLSEKNTSFHTYKPKEERSYRVVLKNLHYSINPLDIKTEIEKLGHTITNIHNIKHRVTKLPLSMFFVDLKPAPNNKEIFQIEYLQQCKIKFEAPNPTRNIPQCTNCQRYGHTKNFCHQKSRCVKCAGLHPTTNCSRKEKSSEVRCVLCDGNHPANYKGCAIYKELQQKTYPSLRPKPYTPPPLIKQTLPTHSGISYAQITKQNISPPIATDKDSYLNHPLPPTQPTPPTSHLNDFLEMKSLMTGLFDQLTSLLSLLTSVLSKLT